MISTLSLAVQLLEPKLSTQARLLQDALEAQERAAREQGVECDKARTQLGAAQQQAAVTQHRLDEAISARDDALSRVAVLQTQLAGAEQAGNAAGADSAALAQLHEELSSLQQQVSSAHDQLLQQRDAQTPASPGAVAAGGAEERELRGRLRALERENACLLRRVREAAARMAALHRELAALAVRSFILWLGH
jgi:chromosome segregation ATPase